MPSNFWNNETIEPKRNFRFLLSIGKYADAQWLVKTADRPKASISSVPHQFLNHTFNYPGRLIWNPVSITLVDPAGAPSDTTKTIDDFLKQSGYTRPGEDNPGTAEASFSAAASAIIKDKAINQSLGLVTIATLGKSAGTTGQVGDKDHADRWQLHNAFVQGDIDFGSLDYGSEELLTISFTLQYDWATLDKSGDTGHK
jgi:hypothetical protein